VPVAGCLFATRFRFPCVLGVFKSVSAANASPASPVSPATPPPSISSSENCELFGLTCSWDSGRVSAVVCTAGIGRARIRNRYR